MSDRPDLRIRLSRRSGIVRVMAKQATRKIITTDNIFRAIADLDASRYDAVEVFLADDLPDLAGGDQ